MILVQEDRYGFLLSIDTKKVPVAFRLTSWWRFNDVIVTKDPDFTGFRRKYSDFQIFVKTLGKCDFDEVFANYERKWQF